MSPSVLGAVHVVLSIFVMIGLGAFASARGMVDSQGEKLLSQMVTRVGLPGMIISNIFGQYTRGSLISSAPALVIPFASLMICFGIAQIAARLSGAPEGRRGVFINMFTFSNAAFIGLPVSIALFGDQAVQYALLYYIANTTIFWSIGVTGFMRDARARSGVTAGITPAQRLKRTFTLPLVTFLSCVALVLLGFSPPRFVMDSARYVGALVTPLSCLFTGVVLWRTARSGALAWQRGFGWISLGRFVIAPLVMIACTRLMAAPRLMGSALIIQSAMPVMAQTPILAALYGADEQYAASGTVLTTLASLVMIPLYMAIMPLIF